MEITSGIFSVIGKYCLSFDTYEVDVLIEYLEEAYYRGKHIFIFGNGGSGATASHFCEDLGKGTLRSKNDSRRFKVMSLTDNMPYILAWANDEGYETIFEQQLRNFAQPGQIAIGISGSGNSPNVLRAIEYANSAGLRTIGMTGFDGGRLREIAQHCVHVPIFEMGIVESIHMIIVHYVVNSLRNRLHRDYHHRKNVLPLRDLAVPEQAVAA
ncbi:MAG: SIS domain-containing protein [candidate division KSB1 bacterium]|nr:SIS domain-containing protein [candidate division KSB1 bacterium]